MKVFREETKTTTTTVCYGRTCDLCGAESKNPDSWSGDWIGDNWHVRPEDETEIKIEVRQKEGTSSPDGGSGTEYEIDLCPSCFKTRLVPWLRSQGADVKEVSWDW